MNPNNHPPELRRRAISAFVNQVGAREAEEEIPEDTINPQDDYLENFKDPNYTQQFSNKVVARQIPGYDEFRRRHATLMRHYAKPGMSVLDVGSSSGDSALDMIAALTAQDDTPCNYSETLLRGFQYTLLDVSQPFNDQAKKSINDRMELIFSNPDLPEGSRIPDGFQVNTVTADAVDFLAPFWEGKEEPRYDMVVCSLTAHFIPIMYRQRFYDGVFRSLKPGGVFLLTDKTLQNNHDVGDDCTTLYHEEKRRRGMTEEAVRRKYESLQKFLHPLTVRANEEMFRQAGFPESDILWKNLAFATFVMKRPEG